MMLMLIAMMTMLNFSKIVITVDDISELRSLMMSNSSLAPNLMHVQFETGGDSTTTPNPINGTDGSTITDSKDRIVREKTGPSMLNGVEAIGYTDEDGYLWGVVCKNTPNGDIPCKLNRKGKAYYSWKGNEYAWTEITKPLPGSYTWFDSKMPLLCKAYGKQNDFDGKGVQDYYAGVIYGDHGVIPGKVDKTRTYAWYSYLTAEIRVTKGFKVLC